jgi:hypothetical protein
MPLPKTSAAKGSNSPLFATGLADRWYPLVLWTLWMQPVCQTAPEGTYRLRRWVLGPSACKNSCGAGFLNTENFHGIPGAKGAKSNS